jgi:hypothetical protein
MLKNGRIYRGEAQVVDLGALFAGLFPGLFIHASYVLHVKENNQD